MHSLKTLLMMLGLTISCSNGGQERVVSAGSSSRTDTSAAADEEDEETANANEPVQVTGAFLTAEFIAPLSDKTPSEMSIGGRAEKNNAAVDMTGLTVTAVVINTATGVTIKTLDIDLSAVEIQYQFNLATSIVAETSIKMDIADADGKTMTMKRELKDMNGVLLTSLKPEQIFDFSGLTASPGTLKAANFCDAAGPMSSVKKTVGGVEVTVAAMTPGAEIALDKTQHCFRKIADYAGTSESSMMTSKEKIGDWVGSGQAHGGTLPCLLVVFDEIAGASTGKPKLFVLKRTDDSFEANLRKTAYEFQCQ